MEAIIAAPYCTACGDEKAVTWNQIRLATEAVPQHALTTRAICIKCDGLRLSQIPRIPTASLKAIDR